MIKSKRDLYQVLALEGQFHLPSIDDCTMDFLRDALGSRKKLLKLTEVRGVNLPRFEEFNCARLYSMGMQDETVRNYLPDPTDKNK